ncbi:MAG: CbrC family protein [Terricaulis sp.]
MSDKPHFRFYPDAYAEGGPFEASDATCDVCQRAAAWLFIGVIYKEDDDDLNVCARCIADGSLRQRVPNYTLHDMEFSEAPEAAVAEEIEQRTPGFSTWNAFVWPVRNGTPLVFLGYGADTALQTVEAEQAIRYAADEWEIDELDPQHALLFRTLDGEETIAVLDFD